jgi:hypothetical protein
VIAIGHEHLGALVEGLVAGKELKRVAGIVESKLGEAVSSAVVHHIEAGNEGEAPWQVWTQCRGGGGRRRRGGCWGMRAGRAQSGARVLGGEPARRYGESAGMDNLESPEVQAVGDRCWSAVGATNRGVECCDEAVVLGLDAILEAFDSVDSGLVLDVGERVAGEVCRGVEVGGECVEVVRVGAASARVCAGVVIEQKGDEAQVPVGGAPVGVGDPWGAKVVGGGGGVGVMRRASVIPAAVAAAGGHGASRRGDFRRRCGGCAGAGDDQRFAQVGDGEQLPWLGAVSAPHDETALLLLLLLLLLDELLLLSV